MAGELLSARIGAVRACSRWAASVVDLAGLDARFGRLAWPVVMLPLLAFVVIVIWRAAAQAPREEGFVVRAGMALLGAALVLELALFPAERGIRMWELLEPSFVALEESAELAGWILLAAGLAGVLVHRIALDSRREAADRRGRDDHPDGLALVAGGRRLRSLR